MKTNTNQASVILSAKPESIMLTPQETAVIVVDMQNAFCSKKGMFDVAGILEEEKVQRVVEANKIVLEAARNAGMKIVYLRMGYRADFSNAGGVNSPNYWKEMGMVLMRSNPNWMGKFVTIGTWDWEIIDDLKPQTGDIVIDKHRYSGFSNTELDTVLQTFNTKYLLFTGLATNICVESTLRDAYSYEYFPILVQDACGNAGPDLTQKATVWNVINAFGWVTTVSKLVEAITPNDKGGK